MKITSLFFEITNKCNKRCSYCYNRENYDYDIDNHLISADLINTLVDEVRSVGADMIILSGGEPTTHPDLYDIIDHVMQNHMYCKINSNAFDCEKLIKIAEKYRNKIHIQFTIDGYYQTHNHFRGQGDYEHILASIIKIRTTGFDGNISVRYNIHSAYSDNYEVVKVYNDIGRYVDYIYLSPIIGKTEFPISIKEYKVLSKTICSTSFDKKGRVSLFLPPMSCTLKNINKSTALSPLIDVFGNVYLCQMSLYKNDFCLGNINNSSLCDILSYQNIMLTSDKIKKNIICNKQCSMKLLCDGGCKGICTKDQGDRYCDLRKMCLMSDIKFKNYQCWG